MKPEQAEYVRYRLARATEAIDEAELLFDGGHLAATVSRSYYACFYAVTALLFTEGHSSSKHSGVLALFDRLWMKTSRLPHEMGGFCHAMFRRRQDGDYKDFATFAQPDVEAWLEEARRFVARISQEIGAAD